MMVASDQSFSGTAFSEGLALELKAWLDPTKPQHAAVLVRTMIALRNHGGGTLLIGYNNDGTPRVDEATYDVDERYHVDRIQDLVSRHASERFEIAVAITQHEGRRYPRVEVPTGVRTPVRVKAALVGERDDEPHSFLTKGEVLVRTLESNGRPSTSEATDTDWEQLMRVCFDNREADIGRFIRRHLGGVAPAIGDLLKTVKAMPSADAAADLLALGDERFASAFAERALGDTAEKIRAWGGQEAALVITPTPAGFRPNQDFLRRMLSSVPRLTSYPPWHDTKNAEPANQLDVRDERWEALVYDRAEFDIMSFELLDPTGRFYQRRLLLPDVIARRAGQQAKMVLGERQAITDVAELFITGLLFAAAMNVGDEHHSLDWAFRWSGLKGRFVDSWFMVGQSRYVAADNVSPLCRVSFPADTPPTALAPLIGQAMAPMFATFRGYEEPQTQIDETLTEVIERRSQF
jgi:hypothetical protein